MVGKILMLQMIDKINFRTLLTISSCRNQSIFLLHIVITSSRFYGYLRRVYIIMYTFRTQTLGKLSIYNSLKTVGTYIESPQKINSYVEQYNRLNCSSTLLIIKHSFKTLSNHPNFRSL